MTQSEGGGGELSLHAFSKASTLRAGYVRALGVGRVGGGCLKVCKSNMSDTGVNEDSRLSLEDLS